MTIPALEVETDEHFILKSGEVFVFGSNLAGIHGAGAAHDALELYGAVWGCGLGVQGRCYAIPTKDGDLGVLPLERIKEYVDIFTWYAGTRRLLKFRVTRVGCGLAGYTDRDIAPLFCGAPYNCILPRGWRDIAREGPHAR